MIFSRNQKPSRRAARLAVPLALSAVALLMTGALGAGSAAAAESCGKKVIDDWYADGRVDGTYLPHCYDDAIEILPRDVRDYSSAKDDITRALQNQAEQQACAAGNHRSDAGCGNTRDDAAGDDAAGDDARRDGRCASDRLEAGRRRWRGSRWPGRHRRRRLGSGAPARPRRARPPARRRRLGRLRGPATAGSPGSAPWSLNPVSEPSCSGLRPTSPHMRGPVS